MSPADTRSPADTVSSADAMSPAEYDPPECGSPGESAGDWSIAWDTAGMGIVGPTANPVPVRGWGTAWGSEGTGQPLGPGWLSR